MLLAKKEIGDSLKHNIHDLIISVLFYRCDNNLPAPDKWVGIFSSLLTPRDALYTSHSMKDTVPMTQLHVCRKTIASIIILLKLIASRRKMRRIASAHETIHIHMLATPFSTAWVLSQVR